VSNPGVGASAFVVFKDGDLYHQQAQLIGKSVTNNFAEYKALLMLVSWAHTKGINGIHIYSDSQLVVKQVNGIWNAKHPLQTFCEEAKHHIKKNNHFLNWVRGHNGNEGNEWADRLCNEVLDKDKKQ